MLNSLSSFTDLFLYWDIPEYADMYASEAVKVERGMKQKNPMVSAQTFINKGRALHQLGKEDSVSFYIGQARELCEALPYNSGMVDIDLLRGALKKAKDDDVNITDDCSAVEYMGMSVKMVQGDERKIKITTPLDLHIAKVILEERQ